MDSYAIVKTVHIISATVLFGTGLGIAFFFLCAQKNKNLAVRLFAANTTVIADFIFTLPAIIIQPVTGIWLVTNSGYHLDETWLKVTYALYVIAGLCWIPVVWIQIKLRDMLRISVASGKALPRRYDKLFRTWFLLGLPAFGGLIVVFFLMVLKPG